MQEVESLAPRRYHILNPGTEEYVTFQGKGDFADMIKLGAWDREIIPDYPMPQCKSGM